MHFPKVFFCLGLIINVMLHLAPIVYASGLGASAGYTGSTVSSHEWNGTVHYREEKVSAGLFYDTNLVKDKLFNYRISAAYENVTRMRPVKEHFEGLAVENDFGFGIATDYARFWLGPEIRLNYNNQYILGVGAGPVAGVNLRFDNGMTLCVKVAYIYSNRLDIFNEDRERAASVSLGLAIPLSDERPNREK